MQSTTTVDSLHPHTRAHTHTHTQSNNFVLLIINGLLYIAWCNFLGVYPFIHQTNCKAWPERHRSRVVSTTYFQFRNTQRCSQIIVFHHWQRICSGIRSSQSQKMVGLGVSLLLVFWNLIGSLQKNSVTGRHAVAFTAVQSDNLNRNIPKYLAWIFQPQWHCQKHLTDGRKGTTSSLHLRKKSLKSAEAKWGD